MAQVTFTDQELLAYIDEALPVERIAVVERALRESSDLRQHAAVLARRRDQGGHTVGEIWRRQRLSCPSRTRLGTYLLGALDSNESDYIRFHIETVGCRYCAANLQDLEQAARQAPEGDRRRRKIFESSAGYLKPEK